MSNLFTTGCCYNSSKIMTNPTEMTIKSELWDINFIKCYSLVYIIIFNISGNRVKFVSFLFYMGLISAPCNSSAVRVPRAVRSS